MFCAGPTSLSRVVRCPLTACVVLKGDDSFCRGYCLNLRKETFGKVYFRAHAHDADETGLHLVADDFVAFVEVLNIDS